MSQAASDKLLDHLLVHNLVYGWCRLPEHSYHIQLHQYQYRLPRSASSISRRQQPQSQGHTEQQHQQAQPDTTAGMAVKLASDTQGMELPLGNNTQQQHSTPATPLQHLQGGQRPWQSRWNNIPPAADQICRPGEVWGTGGRWIEPWDEAAASETVEQLLSHWHRCARCTEDELCSLLVVVSHPCYGR